MSKEANNSNSKKTKHRRHLTILPFITTPLIFVLISMVVVAPVCIFGMNFAIDTVHKAQKTLAMDYNDIQPKMEYNASNENSVSVEIPALSTAQKFGVIKCENAGLCADVFYGMNRVSLRNGVAVDTDGALCGEGKNVEVYGYSSSGFKALNNVKIDDVIVFETSWGIFEYKVVEKSVSQKAPKTANSECLVLATDENKNAFSSFNKDKLYVVAEKVSGPNAKEVQA